MAHAVVDLLFGHAMWWGPLVVLVAFAELCHLVALQDRRIQARRARDAGHRRAGKAPPQ